MKGEVKNGREEWNGKEQRRYGQEGQEAHHEGSAAGNEDIERKA